MSFHVILPPSETKRDGGESGPLDLSTLQFPGLTASRRSLIRAVRTLAQDRDATIAALKLGRTQHHEVARNRTLTTSATMPALDRYTGVLYDALDAPTLSPEARALASDRVLIHSALLGPIGGLDLIPAYRLSHDSKVPEHPLKPHWLEGASRELVGLHGLTLDLRSEAYSALGRLGSDSVYLRIVTRDENGQRRALNHFNKQAKGRLTRSLLEHNPTISSVAELVDWGASAGWEFHPSENGDLELVV